ncbi:MAG TPA: PE family protein [Mycobacterium sp.]|nr:PE family protein [Mycobacterium sp.]
MTTEPKALSAQNTAAAGPATGAVSAAADDISPLAAAQFAAYAAMYRRITAEFAAVHEMFLATINSFAGSYATTEADTRPPQAERER